jgi:hypothetical protein
VGAIQPDDSLSLTQFLLPSNTDILPDFYFVGLQEIVTLNASNVLISSNEVTVEYWKCLIWNTLNKVEKY